MTSTDAQPGLPRTRACVQRLRRSVPVTVVVLFAAAALGGATSAAPSRLTAVAIDSAHVALSWPAVDGAGRYQVQRGQLPIATIRGTTVTDSLLWPRTRYRYTVTALSPSGASIRSFTTVVRTKSLAASGFPLPFPGSRIWSAPVGNAAVVPNSAALIAYLVAHVDSPNMTLRAWGVAVAEAQPGDPHYRVRCGWCALGRIPIPVVASPDPQEGHLAIFEPATGHEWDMYEASRSAAGWTATSGSAVSVQHGNPTIPRGHTGANAANIPLLAGIVRPEEILQGHIDHALVFTTPGVSSLGHVCPASKNDGSSTDPNALKEGMRLQLDPAVDVGALPIPAWEKTLARAMQTYGMYLTDQGGSTAVIAEDPISRGYDAWKLVGMPDGDSVPIVGIPWDRFRVVSAPC